MLCSWYDEKGILYIGLEDFLLNPKSVDMWYTLLGRRYILPTLKGTSAKFDSIRYYDDDEINSWNNELSTKKL